MAVLGLKNIERPGTGDKEPEGKPGRRSERRQKESGGFSGALRRVLVVGVLIFCALFAVVVAVDAFAREDSIYPGVRVGGVHLGGKTLEEAAEALQNRAPEAFQEIRFVGPAGESSLTGEELGLRFDADETAERAYAVGRESSVPASLLARITAPFDPTVVEPAVEYSPEAARSAVERLAVGVNQEPRNAAVNIAAGEVEVSESREGYEIDVPATLRNLDMSLDRLNGEVEIVGRTLEPTIATPAAREAAEQAGRAVDGPVVLVDEGREFEIPAARVGRALDLQPVGNSIEVGVNETRLQRLLSGVVEAVNRDVVDASYTVDAAGVSVTPSQTGRIVNEEELLSTVSNGLFEGGGEFQVPVYTTEPELTTAAAEQMKPTEMLGSYRTDYTLTSDTSAERIENLQIASSAINNTLLAPGEVFSANELLIPLDYNATKVIIQGKEDTADGGGLCQVASTLYMAVNYAGLEIVERHPHSSELGYIRPGLDATVWFGEKDFRFQNSSDSYVLIRQYVADDNFVYAEIWGQPNGMEVTMNSELTSSGGNWTKWTAYKTVEQNGEVIEEERLYTDEYWVLYDEDGQPLLNPYPAPVNY